MSDKTEIIDLFPLGTVLLPYGRLPLQIFETRYLDLISDCLKNSKGFGVVLIDQGEEVIRKKDQQQPTLKRYGCYADIVHWDGLPNQRLAVIVEGKQVFEILESWTDTKSKRMQARVQFLEVEEPIARQPEMEDIYEIFQRLLAHPMIEAHQYSSEWDDVNSVSFALGQLLPIDKKDRYSLLTLDCEQRVQALQHFIEALGGH